MKMAHLNATFPPYQGGTGNVCYYNARELARRGHALSVFSPSQPAAPSNELMDGIQVIRLEPALRFGNAAFLPQLNRLVSEYDLVHFHYPFFGGELAALGARRQGKPLVITYHQDVHLQGLAGWVEKILRQTTSRWVLRSAERLLFTSTDYGRASHAQRLLKGREASIGELPNGVDAAFFSPGAPPVDWLVRFRRRGDEIIALLVAALDQAHYFKGVAVLLKALAGLPANYTAILVGEGDLRPGYQALADELGLSERVTFVGRVSGEDLRAYYRLVDVTVLPSTTMGEAFGLVLLEAMACERPVIASNLPGVRSVVTEGLDGWLVPPGDPVQLGAALSRLGELSAAERQAMGTAGRRKVIERYTWEALGARLEAIYQEVLG